MRGRVVLGSFGGVMFGVLVMGVGHVRMMSGLVVVSGFMVLGSFVMVMSCLLVMLRGLVMMICGFL